MSGSPQGHATPGERWISFLRSYGPINKIDGMYAETVARQAQAHGVAPLAFEHPEAEALAKAIAPAEGRLTNIILTGTAGDGKTSLCSELWHRLTGDESRKAGRDRSNYGKVALETPDGERTLHFIFEFSGFTPEQRRPWMPEQIDLLNRFARSVFDPEPREYFVLAANDGKLVQAFDSLPDSADTRVKPLIETLLTRDHRSQAGAALLFLNLSRMSTRELLERALDCLLGRAEWACFDDEASDPAFSPASPLTRNFQLLHEPRIRERLQGLGELCDSNGFHVSIREVLLLLVNGLLGYKGGDGVARPDALRDMVRDGRHHDACLYDNLLGANLTEARRERFAVFRFLTGFRIGLETSNALDALLVFGQNDADLQPHHQRLLADDTQYGVNPVFERLREAYLEADEDRGAADEFHAGLIAERRRLFFRLTEEDPRFDPWQLSVFQSAGAYRSQLLAPLRASRAVNPGLIARLVQGLNRVWTGMLAGALDKLYLTTGLDFTTARVSDLYLNAVPIELDFNGSGLSLGFDPDRHVPVLHVHLRQDHDAALPLTLMRFEFLMRVAHGALPSSFSKECYEDIISFKTRVLSDFYRINQGRSVLLSILSTGADGAFATRQLGIRL
ncbi:hypothetical protein [Mesorhizobium sp. WSM3873]|uniref:hypothetical protein n=1 Tax=Mesorhizobium sp. WSM3873 TaxID=1854056 RepID=UPI0007FEA1AB|nr:hypothetical protein [Mesorhizobium sp. WSM3873]OBQ86434.1 hypothetical protein A9K71_17020 [Mesorhizobium sp. WSM3873]TIW60249.1 MAG: hypothetical protein E5V48_14435 [Mesorhizobium sp.]TJW91359.1 MAG: hypothetical protein E5V92_00200 [Mesorhizobium sp.]